MKRRVLLIFLAVLGTLPLIFGACARVPEEEVEPIRIGGAFPLTGVYAGDGLHMYQAEILAVEDINAQGGVLGRPLELIPFDIEDMMAEKLISAADTLVMKEKVDAVICGYAGMGPDIPAFGKYDVPFLHNDATANCVDMVRDNYDEYWNVFMLCWRDSEYLGREEFTFATHFIPESSGYVYPNNKVAILTADFEWDISCSTGYRRQAEKEGWDVIMYEVFPYGTVEWGPILTKIRAEEPALIMFTSMDIITGITFTRQFLENPTDSILDMMCTMWWCGYLETLGEEADGQIGWWGQEPIPTEDDPAGIELKRRYEERFGIPPAGSWVVSYDGIWIWAEAVKRVGDPRDYRAICQAMIDYPYQGKCAKYVFDAEDGNGMQASVDEPVFYVQIQDGKKVNIAITGEPDTVNHVYHVLPFPYPECDAGVFQVPPWIK